MTQKSKRILVTAALPYANGPIHIGHLVEYIQTDIWARYQRMAGNRCVYICADDTHGTAIMIRARKEGRSEIELIADVQKQHERDFTGFEVSFDHYGSTNCEENRLLCHEFWKAFRANNLIVEREVTQLYDPQAETFLADRFVKGTCPQCKSPNQYGDNCDKCNSTYAATDLIDPVSTLTGAKPETRKAKQLFVELEKLHEFLDDWSQKSGALQSEVSNYLKGHFLNAPLRDWDISRPARYFGFEIPDSPGNYWFVWFDAPIGYIASTWQWCKKNGEKLEDWWKSSETEVHHFIGKDIQYFHTLFWPGMLKTAGFTLPTKVHIHGFLTVDGEKMSKSKGTFVKAETYLKHLDPTFLRYYYATKLGPRLDDLDLAADEFINKVNSDLVGKFVNLASRTSRFVQATGLAKAYPEDGGLFAEAAKAGEEIAAAFDAKDTNRATRLIMELADKANKFVDDKAPWKIAKDPARAGELLDVCTVALNLFRQLAIYLAPITPQLARLAGDLLSDPLTTWSQAQKPLVGTAIAPFQKLLDRVERKDLDLMIEESKETPTETAAPAPAASASTDTDQWLTAEPLAPTCTIDDFTKVDLRVARIINAEHVPEAKKLLKLTVSLGGENTRTVFAGIKAAYEPEKLVGRLVVVVANLQPRQMKFGLSEGMVTAAGAGGAEVYLLALDSGAQPGMRVH